MTTTERPTTEAGRRLSRIIALEEMVLDLGGDLGYFEHGIATRTAKPSDPDDQRWECLCGIGGSPDRIRRHWKVELTDWHAVAELDAGEIEAEARSLPAEPTAPTLDVERLERVLGDCFGWGKNGMLLRGPHKAELPEVVARLAAEPDGEDR